MRRRHGGLRRRGGAAPRTRDARDTDRVGDPLGAGFIASLSRPGGNLTGLMTFEASISGKWLTMLKAVAATPGLGQPEDDEPMTTILPGPRPLR